MLTASEPFQNYTAAYHGTGFGRGDLLAQYDASAEESANAILADVDEKAKKIGVECETVHLAHRLPAEAIVATAREKGASLVVMASHGRRGVSRLLLGSQAAEVVGTSEVPVLIIR